MTWLPQAMHVLRDRLPNIQVVVSSDYSPYLADALTRGDMDLAFMRREPLYDHEYRVVDREPRVVVMPGEHRLTACEAVSPQELASDILIGGSNKAGVLRTVTDDYLRRCAKSSAKRRAVRDRVAVRAAMICKDRHLLHYPHCVTGSTYLLHC